MIMIIIIIIIIIVIIILIMIIINNDYSCNTVTFQVREGAKNTLRGVP
jgi:hypothetical protein